MGRQTGAATVGSSTEIAQKLKMDLAFDPRIPLLGIYPKKFKTVIWNNISTPMFIAASFTISKIWKQPKCLSVDEWISNYRTFTQWKLLRKKKKKKEKKKILPFEKV